MFPQAYRRDNASSAASTSTSPLTFSSGSASPTPSPSSSSGGPFSKGSSSSFFTFLVALLILVLASGALVVRAIYLRRRFRNQVQAAIDAGILNPTKLPVPQTKPEMHEIYVRSLPNDAVEWENFLPISAITVDEPILQFSDKESKLFPSPSPPRLTLRQRLTNTLRRSPMPSSFYDTSNEHSVTPRVDDSMTTPSRVQVAVLIAMPSEHSSIHPLYEEVDAGDVPKGKRRDSSLHDDFIPDVIFGISSLPLESSAPAST